MRRETYLGAWIPEPLPARSLHGQVRVPAARMFGRNATLSIARSHARQAIPGVLALVAAGRLHPEQVTSTVAPVEDAPEALRAHLLGADLKTVLVRDHAG